MRANTTDRGQAYTLEGFISAMVVLVAVLLAMQSVVITPTTGGAADRTVQGQVQQEAQDALVAAAAADADDGNLAEMIHELNEDGMDNGSSEGLIDPYEDDVYSPNDDQFNDTALGETLEERFDESGQNYNVELYYEDDDIENRSVVYQGSPSSNAVSASYMVTFDDGPDIISGCDSDSCVVEVRVIVW